jgi:hypothetical protein
MTGLSLAYAQARIQSRYGDRADPQVWLKLHNIHDLGSYLQSAQQSPLRPWVLGISASYSSHDIELVLRQKYRYHVDEVAGWMPLRWQRPLRWIKRLVDLPALQHLASGGEPMAWMTKDPALTDFTVDDPLLRIHAMRDAGQGPLVDAWQQDGTMLSGWLTHWNKLSPGSLRSDDGLARLEKVLREGMQRVERQKGPVSPTDYEALLDTLRLIFRRHAFRPAAVCAYLVIIATDLHRLRSDLMQRMYFIGHGPVVEGSQS